MISTQLQVVRHFSLPGGGTTYCLALAREFRRRGIQVSGLCPKREGDSRERQWLDGFAFTSYRLPKAMPLLWRVPALGRTSRYLKIIRGHRASFDFVVSRYVMLAFATKRCFPGVPVIYVPPCIESFPAAHTHSTSYNRGPVLKRFNQWVHYRAEAKALRAVDAVLFSSQRFMEWATEWFGYTGPNWLVCPFGVEDTRPRVRRRRDKVRRELQIPEDALVLITVCRLDPVKNIDLLISAVAQARTTKLHFLVVGDGCERTHLQSLTKSLNLQRRVHFCGFVPDPADLYWAADVFAMASSFESFGQCYLEAMVSELPVIAPRHDMPDTFSVADEIMEEQKTGFTFDRGNVQELASLIDWLADNEEARRQMGISGRKRALRQHSWRDHASRILRLAGVECST